MRIDLYEDLYKTEDTYWWHIGKRMFVRTFLMKHSGPDSYSSGRILDIGCGTGRMMEELREHGQVVGIDISPKALEFCQKRGLRHVYWADLNSRLDLPDENFDLVVGLDILEHLENDDFALSEIYRLLKRGGLFLLSVPAFPWLWSYWDEILAHKRRYTSSQLRFKVEKVGFKVRRLSFIHCLIFLPSILIRMVRGFIFKTSRNKATSDFIALPKIMNDSMIVLYKIENFFLKTSNLPVGLSLMLLVQKT